MFDRLFCHIGAHKTATSSIQGSLWHNNAALRDDGLYNVRQPGGILATVCDMPEALVPVRMRGLRGPSLAKFADEAVSRLREASGNDGLHDAVISTEHCLTLNDDEIGRLAELLTPLAKEVEVIYYLRHPAERLASYLGQEVKTGHARLDMDLATYLEDYAAIFAPWQAHFGEDALKLRRFVPAEMPHQSPVADFLHAIGHPDLYDRIEERRANPGLSQPAALIANAVNGSPGAWADRIHLIGQLEGIGGAKLSVPAARIDALGEQIDAQLAWLKQHHGIELPAPEATAHTTDRNAILDDAALASIGEALVALAQDGLDLERALKAKTRRLVQLKRQAGQGDV